MIFYHKGMLIITDFKLNLKNQQICLTEVEWENFPLHY